MDCGRRKWCGRGCGSDEKMERDLVDVGNAGVELLGEEFGRWRVGEDVCSK